MTSFACRATLTHENDAVVCLPTLDMSDGAQFSIMEAIFTPEYMICLNGSRRSDYIVLYCIYCCTAAEAFRNTNRHKKSFVLVK